MFKDTIVVALGTAASRITGLLRVIVFGIVIGQTALADAYDGANNSPNSIYELLVGGVLAAGLVPLFTRLTEDDDREGTNAVFTVSLIVLAVATAIAVTAAPLIFRLFSLHPSSTVDAAEYRSVGTMLARIFLVQIFFYGLSAVGSAMLNARRRFFAAAWAPVLANLVTIALLLMIPLAYDGAPGLGDVSNGGAVFWMLTLGATGGIAIMAVVLLPAIKQSGMRLAFVPNFRHPAVKTLASMSVWSFGYVLTNQVALVVVKNLARPGSGNQDAYSKAFTFFVLPHGLLAISIATTFVPEMVRRVKANDRAGFANWLTDGFRWIAFLSLPASVAMTILAHPIVSALLEHGNFSPAASLNTARALAGFSVGLLGFSLYVFALRGFYAHHDTRTPFFINLGENVLNVVLALVLVDRHGVLGLGLAFGLAYMVASVVVMFELHRRYHAINWPVLAAYAWRGIVATAVMSAALLWLNDAIDATTSATRLAEAVGCTVIGLGIYVVVMLMLRAKEVSEFQSQLLRRSQRAH